MKKRNRLVFLILIIGFLIFFPHGKFLGTVSDKFKNNGFLVSQDTEKLKKEAEARELEKKKQDRIAKQTTLVSDLKQTLSVNTTYSISVLDINNDESLGIETEKQFHAASVMKLLVATAALQGVEQGKYKLDSRLGNGTFEYQLKQMINQSNNNSWDLFNNLLGFDGEQKVADELGLVGIQVWGNQMTTGDVAKLLHLHYKGKILSNENRDLLFSFMQKTETENRITKGLPTNIVFYHKTGTFGGGMHDAAIVVHPKNPFILVIFTNDTTGAAWETRFASFASATAKVYSYFDQAWKGQVILG